ncbi:hypothetical protein BO78DRAFT_426072 [Aspergillus sclerotiicarbonarius CBS 121057]|uniref:C2H2-type domain-containing protein n=1 Tax=Aspergillus sclerotiicarbonarius (strain CBS 121057 / IBT 28362) TaxID=1448318 RepID=A0A319FMT7_ASPSB|nr:hypothetical protein BO78DRAFT_426072 [Aspergillus sclerotiicarbonarius CBS 121057]
MASPNPVDAPPHVLQLLSELHKVSLEQEALISPTGKTFSAKIIGDLQAKHPAANPQEEFDQMMLDKFIALDEDKCQFTYQLINAMGATNVVEAGTSFGVSTIYLALAVAKTKAATSKAGTVIATEKEKAKADVARKYWVQCGATVEEQIDLREGDLLETLKENLPEIDLLLLDIWSKLALPTLKTVLPRLRPGAVVLTDNTISGAQGYAELLAFLRSPESGFRNMTLPFTNGFEMSVYQPQSQQTLDRDTVQPRDNATQEETQGWAGRTAYGPDEEAAIPDQPSKANKNKRAFRCQFRSKDFLRNEHLQRHERLHTKEKPFRCTVCSQGFTRSDLLARHARMAHEDGIIDDETQAAHPHRQRSPPRSRAMPGDMQSAVDFPFSHVMSYPEQSAAPNLETPSGDSLAPATVPSANVPHMPWAEPTSNFGDFALFIDSMMMPCGSTLSTAPDQPILQFSPTPIFGSLNSAQTQSQSQGLHVPTDTSTPRLFDEFTSTLPSFEPSFKPSQEPGKITQETWNHLLAEIQMFTPVLPPHFFLPSLHTMTRYITAYFSGFHRHLPLIHVPTFSPTKNPVELILAMATIGAQSAFDHDHAIMFYKTSLAICHERLRCRKAQHRERAFSTIDRLPTDAQPSQPPLSPLAQGPHPGRGTDDQFDPLPLAQTLLVLMAMATWGNSKAIFNEAVEIQTILASYVRQENLLNPRSPQDTTWHSWIKTEGINRTITIIFCFFIFHTIVYNTPPPIVNSELQIHLPSRETDWEVASEGAWKEARSKSPPETTFQSSFSLLFSHVPDQPPVTYSSLGGYTLILALIQHIYFLRETSKHRPNHALSPTDVTEVEQALRTWQRGWDQDPESFLGPGSPRGPISFNSTALLRIAYMRLNVDLGPCRALTTHSPHELPTSMYRYHQTLPMTLSSRLTRAVLYSAHALSIPVKIGVNIVARNQASAWSLQHALCALKCAFVISQWLIAVQSRVEDGSTPDDEEEVRLLAYITDMVAEADPAGENGPGRLDLCTRVIRIWAKLLSGDAVWDVVRLIGKALAEYACMLEGRATGVLA